MEVKTQVIDDVSEATWEDGIPFLDQKDLDPEEIPFGQLSIQSGRACLNMLKLGIELFQAGKIDGFSFAPLNKVYRRSSRSRRNHWRVHGIRYAEEV